MNEPLLSVIIPIYNVAPYLDRCLNSVCNQTYKNLEIICVDDGSTDNSRHLLDKWQKKDARIISVHKTNQGLVSARKIGAKLATGEYITNVDSDDWIESEMYTILMSELIQSESDMIMSLEIRDYGSYQVKEQSELMPGVYEGENLGIVKSKMINTNEFFKCNISGHLWNKIFKTSIYREKQLSVPNVISIGEDSAVTYPYIFAVSKVHVTDNYYYHYCLRADSVMGERKPNDKDSVNAYCEYIMSSFELYQHDIDTARLQGKLLAYYARLFRNIENTMYYRSEILFPYGRIKEDERIMVYGAGKFGVELHEYLDAKGWFKEIIWADKTGINGALRIDDIDLSLIEKVIVAVLRAEAVKEIKGELFNRGMDERRILSVDIDLIKGEINFE